MVKAVHIYDGFKLLNLSVIEHDVLGTNTFSFVDEKDQPNSIYFSVLIGPNGTGKSEVLGMILTLFRNICRLENGDGIIRLSGWYKLTYSSFGKIYCFSNYPVEWRDGKIHWGLPDKKIKPYLLENGLDTKYKEFKEASKTLPAAIIANSIMLTDKYFVPRNEKEQHEFPMYRYLGVRQRPQQASTRYYVRKTVEFIVNQIDSTAFNNGIKSITKFLGGERSVHVLFYTAYTTKFFHGDITIADLDDYFNPIIEKYKGPDSTAPFKATYYESMRKDSNHIQKLCDYVNMLKNTERLEHINRSSVKRIRYNIGDTGSYNLLKNEYKYLDDLRKLGIVHAPEVTMVDEKEVFLQNSSSGEFHFFSTMVGLMASIQPNSLILIDEPEISLHPNWQMKYLMFLRELFSSPEYKSCQVIVATHSHFMISDLVGRSSNIIGLKKESGKINTIDIDFKNTFGWSAEEVLLKIFNVPTTRNYYIADGIGDILELVSKEDRDEMLISKKVKKMMSQNVFELSKNDPLSSVWKKLVTKYG